MAGKIVVVEVKKEKGAN